MIEWPTVAISATIDGAWQMCRSVLATLGVPRAAARSRQEKSDCLGAVPWNAPIDLFPYRSFTSVSFAAISSRA